MTLSWIKVWNLPNGTEVIDGETNIRGIKVSEDIWWEDGIVTHQNRFTLHGESTIEVLGHTF